MAEAAACQGKSDKKKAAASNKKKTAVLADVRKQQLVGRFCLCSAMKWKQGERYGRDEIYMAVPE